MPVSSISLWGIGSYSKVKFNYFYDIADPGPLYAWIIVANTSKEDNGSLEGLIGFKVFDDAREEMGHGITQFVFCWLFN